MTGRGLRVRIAAGAQGPDEQLRAVRLGPRVPIDRYRAAGVIDEELLAGEVPLAHRALQPCFPAPVDLAEGAAAVGGRTVLRAVLLPQQLQRYVPVALEILVDPGAVGRHEPQRRTACRYFETAPTDNPSAAAMPRTPRLLDCSAISCFNFDMETLSFGMRTPQDKKVPSVRVLPDGQISSRSPPSPPIVNTFPRS